MTLISLRILVGYAKSTHRNLAQLCRVPYQPRPRPAGGAARSAVEVDPHNDDGNNDNGNNDNGRTAEEQRPPSSRAGGGHALYQIEDDDDQGEGRRGLPWDPLAPRLLQEVHRLAKEGRERPFTAAVVMAAALPFSGAAIFFGAPVLAGDAALQWGASTPIGRTVGQGTKNAVEVGQSVSEVVEAPFGIAALL